MQKGDFSNDMFENRGRFGLLVTHEAVRKREKKQRTNVSGIYLQRTSCFCRSTVTYSL